MTAPRPVAPSERLSHKLAEAAELLSIGKTRLDELIGSGQIVTYREGSDRRVSHRELLAYVERRDAEARAQNIAFQAQYGRKAAQG